MRNGDGEHRIGLKSGDEVGDMASAFDGLVRYHIPEQPAALDNRRQIRIRPGSLADFPRLHEKQVLNHFRWF